MSVNLIADENVSSPATALDCYAYFYSLFDAFIPILNTLCIETIINEQKYSVSIDLHAKT
jgi:hypothetical protein